MTSSINNGQTGGRKSGRQANRYVRYYTAKAKGEGLRSFITAGKVQQDQQLVGLCKYTHMQKDRHIDTDRLTDSDRHTDSDRQTH